MWTIFASKAKNGGLYTLLYSGQHETDLSRYPNQCCGVLSAADCYLNPIQAILVQRDNPATNE